MSNLTLAVDDDLLRRAREYAQRHGTSVNALVRHLLAQVTAPPEDNWFDALTALADEDGGVGSGKRRWTRMELHERPRPKGSKP